MRMIKRAGFMKHFIGGFALGAAALVGVNSMQLIDQPVAAAPQQPAAVVTPIG